MISQSVIDTQVASLLEGVPDGEDLDEHQVILLNYALRACGSTLDAEGAREWLSKALGAGITPEQLHEVVTLMSSIGVHTFFESSRALAAATEPPGGWGPLDQTRQELWDRYVGSTKYWTSMEEEIEGFLEALLRMSPEVFEAFIIYVGIPFKSRLVPNLTKEIISMAADACPAHQYLPGMRMHLRNAVRAGAGRLGIEHAMRIAAASPAHVGVK
jgi:alkylhydroperoxidase/carboxymuconolactone decarboxylase family protein YurZ